MKFMQYIDVWIKRFTALVDTPASYTGEGGKVVKVKVDETGLEFATEAAGGGASPPTTVTSITTNTDSGTDHTHELDELHAAAKSTTYSSVTIDKKGRVTALSSGSLSVPIFSRGVITPTAGGATMSWSTGCSTANTLVTIRITILANNAPSGSPQTYSFLCIYNGASAVNVALCADGIGVTTSNDYSTSLLQQSVTYPAGLTGRIIWMMEILVNAA